MMLQESKGQPRRVVIEGVVACSEPIETKHTSSASKVVAYSLTEIAHYAIRGIFSWSSDEKHQSSFDSVPFRLNGESSGVNGPSVLIPPLENSETNGSSQMLSIMSDVTEDASFTFQQFMDQMRSLGRVQRSSQYVESGLEVGSHITLVGPVGMRRDGQMKMVSQPILISRRTRYDLIAEAEENASSWKYVFYACAAVAGGCVAYMAYQYLQENLQRRLARRRLNQNRERKYRQDQKNSGIEFVKDSKMDSEADPSCGGDTKGSDDDGTGVRSLCVVCQENAADCVLMNCKHLHTCMACTMRLSPKNCPICRQPIRRVIKVYN